MSVIRITVPAGKYIVGDPCYAIRDSDWDYYLKVAGLLEDKPPMGVFILFKGAPVLAFHTAHGDGEFPGSNGRQYGVDAGLIGLVHTSIGKITFEEAQSIIEFKEPTVCVRDGGTLIFGNLIIIETDDEEDEEDEDFDEDEDDFDDEDEDEDEEDEDEDEEDDEPEEDPEEEFLRKQEP